MIMFFIHNPSYRKKALCVSSLVWSQDEHLLNPVWSCITF